MAKLNGGLHGEPNGKVANIVYSKARGRNGKVVTARQKVDPSNPQTQAQQDQRGKFQKALNIVQFLGSPIYSSDLNRAVGDLPGFQSLQKIFLDNLDSSGVLSKPSDISLGQLDHLASLSQTLSTTSPTVSLSFNSDSGDLGTSSDEVVAFAMNGSTETDGSRNMKKSVGSTTRDGSPIDLDVGVESGDTIITGVYVRGQGSADGLISDLQFLSGTV